MTAFAISFERRRLVVAYDTLGYCPTAEGRAKPLGFLDKALPVTRLRAVLFARGQMQVAVEAAASLMLRAELARIEDAAEAMPEMLGAIARRYAGEHGIADHRSLNMAEIVFGGWSERDGRMKLWGFNNYEDFLLHDDRGLGLGLLTMPALAPADMPPLTGLPCERALVEAMKAERRFFDAHPELMGGQILGGEIRAIEVTPQGIGQRTLARFEDFEATRHAAAAVAGRILRGEDSPSVAEGLVRVDDCTTAAAASAAGETRQQRRAAERARKARAA